MSTHSDSINPMSSFLKFSGISIVSIIILILLNDMLFKDETKEQSAQVEDKETVIDPKQIAENIKPIGQVTLTAATNTGAAQAPRSSEEIYKTTCSVCHLTGVANAPKIDDKAAWEPRIAAGLASLITNATNGKGAMPPRGGKADLSDDELNATILYMADLAGFKLSEPVAENTAATPSAESEVTSAPTVSTPEIPPVAPVAPIAPDTLAPIVTPKAPSPSIPVVTPEAPSPSAPIITPEPSSPTLAPEAAINPEAAALGYVLIPPTQPLPLVQPIAPQFPQQPVPTM